MKKLLLLCFTLFSFASQAQDTLGMHSAVVPDTGIYGSIDSSFYATIINNGDSNFSGNITVYLGIEKNSIVTIEDSIVLTANLLTPGDTIGGNFLPQTYDSTTTQYRVGGNIVVIWPAANSAITSDSVKTDLYIKDISSGIETNNYVNRLKAYPNPTSQYIYVSQTADLSIYSYTGSLLKYSKNVPPDLPFDVSALPAGVYFIELKSRENDTFSTLKLVKQ